jgi:hypothetical protein
VRLLRLISIASDLSETSLEDAIKYFAKGEHYSLVVGSRQAAAARRLQQVVPEGLDRIFVNPEWEHEWAVFTWYNAGTFSEGAGV